MEPRELQQLTPEQRVIAQQLNEQINALLNSSVSLEKIAELVGAEDYIDTVSRGRTTARQFDVKRWVQDVACVNVQLQLPTNIEQRKEVLLPPDEIERSFGEGDGEYQEPGSIPRTRLVMEVLTEEGVPYSVVEGENTDNMMRGKSYVVFLIPDRNKAVFVNNEEGNASFIVHQLDDVKDWELYAAHTKQELKGRDDVSVIIWPGVADQWKELLRMHLHSEYVPEARREREVGDSLEDVPADWMSVQQLADYLEASYVTARTLMLGKLDEHPDMVVRKLNAGKRRGNFIHPDLAQRIKEERDRLKVKPGWKSALDIANSTGRSPQLVAATVEEYRSDQPEWFAVMQKNMGKPSEHYSPELAALVEAALTEVALAPEGWLTIKGAARALGKSENTIKRAAESYRAEHPEWFTVYLTAVTRKTIEHFSPELIQVLQEVFKQQESAPTGWLTNSRLANELNVTFYTVANIAEEYRSQHPEWFSEYLGAGKKLSEHFHPDLVAIVRERLSRYEQSPAGWLTATGLAKVLDVTPAYIRKLVDEYRNNEGWFKVFLASNAQPAEHLDPALCAIISERIQAIPSAPNGWHTSNSVTNIEGVKGAAAVRQMAEQYRSTHPQWFAEYRDANGHVREHLHPDLISTLVKRMSAQEAAPEGWLTTFGLAKEMGVTHRIISHIAEQYRSTHPQWFHAYLDAINRQREHYHPDLVALIQAEYNKYDSAPDGWLTRSALASELKVDKATINGRSKKYLTRHPEWEVVYRSSNGRAARHLHPDLINSLKQELEK